MRGAIIVAALLTTVVPAGCGEAAGTNTLTLAITSDAPPAGGRIDTIRVLFYSDGQRFPDSLADPMVNLPVAQELDPTRATVYVGIRYEGATFEESRVGVLVTGYSSGVAATQWAERVDLDQVRLVAVHLSALGDACDADGDGFPDCSAVGCCPGDTTMADCEPDNAQVNPWVVEPACEPCGDTLDNDCAGGDVPCVDGDDDGVADCEEEAAGCTPDEPQVAPGKDERCDGLDNDCDGETDEGFPWEGVAVGGSCGVGKCAGGVVVCDGATKATCSSLGLADPEETCANGIDDDCNGIADEGCVLDDVDGDGFTAGDDCNDFDSGVFPGAPEGCCSAPTGDPEAIADCDTNCDGETKPCPDGDGDGDGFAPPTDCDDSDPFTYPGASEICGDGIDQDCWTGDVACDEVVDEDGDGWSPPVEGQQTPYDCDDGDPELHPGVAELCNGVDDDCDGLVDEGNPQGGDPCGTDVGECVAGFTVCANNVDVQGELVCPNDVEPSDELCDGLDNDCDGEVDEDFLYEGVALGDPCDGEGACGTGVTECLPGGEAATCSTNPDGSTPQGGPETCDGVDEDCDGETDEDFDVGKACDGEDEDNCANGTLVCNDAGDGSRCDESMIIPEELCDGLDNDCDGQTDEDWEMLGAPCDGNDQDKCKNGTWTCGSSGTSVTCANEAFSMSEDCNGEDDDCDGLVDEDWPLGEPCDGLDKDKCPNAVWECSPEGGAKAVCGEETITDIEELCNGDDDDCDGKVDEDFKSGGTVSFDGGPYQQDPGSKLGDACGTGACAGGTVVCTADGEGLTCDTLADGVSDETCNYQDDDCDGETDEGFGDCDDCDPNPCLNGGTCVDGEQSYTCQCAEGWEGPNCENANPCVPNPCDNGGSCTTDGAGFTCECAAGWDGPTCAIDIDDCESAPCLNGGVCSDGVDSFTCSCVEGYAGTTCETNIDDCDPDPCLNGGSCVDGVASYTCQCPAGWGGTHCQTDLDQCADDPCENGGTCIDGVGTFTCTCLPGWDGPTCGINLDDCDPDPCDNGGTCIDGVDSYTCQCLPGFTGDDCEINIDDCPVSNPCANGGTCVDGVQEWTCDCTTGWTGATCTDYNCTELDCADSDPCTVDTCSPATGCSNTVPEVCPNDIAIQSFNGYQGYWTLRGSAAVVSDRLRVTPNSAGSQGAAWLSEKVEVASGFLASFAFSFNKTSGTGADGMAFVVHNLGDTLSCGEEGPQTDSIAVAFDSYVNGSEIGSQTVTVWQADTVVAETDLGGDWSDGVVVSVRISLDNDQLEVSINDTPELTGVPISLAAAGATDADGKAWVGFSARTGADFEAHNVWGFSLATSCSLPTVGCMDPDNECGGAGICQRPVRSPKSCTALGWGNGQGSTAVCADSDPEGPCSGYLDWAGAVDFCNALGARLCTLDELLANETAGTGCQYDAQQVWSSTRCFLGGQMWVAGGNTGQSLPTECVPPTDTTRVARCCADAVVTPGPIECVPNLTFDCRDQDPCTVDQCSYDIGCSSSTASSCPDAGGGDCCSVNGSAGCNDQNCQTCVCALDASCCDTDWTPSCADATLSEDCWQSCFLCSL